MAEQKQVSWLNMALDFSSMAVYILAYRYYKTHSLDLFGQHYEGIVAATIISIPFLLLTMAISRVVLGEITPMQIFTAIVLIFFGGLTIYFNNESFTKMRPSIVYGSMALVLSFGVFVKGRSYFQWIMGRYMELSDADWLRFTKAYIVFMIIMVLINEYVRRFMSDDIWVWLDTIGQGLLGLLFMATQMPLLLRNMKESE